MNWYCEVFQLLLVRHWEGEVFLYNPLTTQTHILNELGWQLLRACSAAPVDQERLFEQMSEAVDGELGEAGSNPSREELAEFLNTHLDQLSQLGLLELSADRAA